MRKELLPEGKLDLNAQRPKMGQRAPEPR
jgi:hypothetical protein